MNQQSKIAILGFGVEGKSLFDYLTKHGYSNITICDQNLNLEQDLPQGTSARLGVSYMDDLQGFEIIFRSPGIRFRDPKIQFAISQGAKVTSITGLFLDQCPCPVVGVTGTKGKGTTSTLIYKILKQAGKDVYLGGNIGEPPLIFLDKLTHDSIAVLEMSSFQLQDLKKSPRYSIFLNTTKDHLDYHEDVSEYMQAKESILTHQSKDSIAILNNDYEYSKYYKPLVKGHLYEISTKEELKNGAYVKDGDIYLQTDKELVNLMPTNQVKLIGAHNLENVLPASLITFLLGVEPQIIRKVVEEFTGLPHRLQLVTTKNDVRYFNDSFSTTPETSMSAVDSFDEPTVLIAGGFDKGLDYDEWALKILTKPSLQTVVLIGDLAPKMEGLIKEAEQKLGDAAGSPTKVFNCGHDFQKAFNAAVKHARPGGVVILSPASASFDMFKDYKDRGHQFEKLAKTL